jgi:hypothetical protein
MLVTAITVIGFFFLTFALAFVWMGRTEQDRIVFEVARGAAAVAFAAALIIEAL